MVALNDGSMYVLENKDSFTLGVNWNGAPWETVAKFTFSLCAKAEYELGVVMDSLNGKKKQH